MSGVVQAHEPPAAVLVALELGDGSVLDVAGRGGVADPNEGFERGGDDTAVARDHNRLAVVIGGQPCQRGVDAPHELVDTLRPRSAGPIAIEAEVEPAVPGLPLVPAQPFSLAAVDLAHTAVDAQLEPAVADRGSDDLGRLRGTAHEAGVQRGRLGQIARPGETIAERLRLAAAPRREAPAAVADHHPVDRSPRLAVTDEDEASHTKLSTKPSSCLRFRHSNTPSQWMPYSPTIESPVSQ